MCGPEAPLSALPECDASDDEGSGSDFGSEGSEGDDWDELERKAAKGELLARSPPAGWGD